MTYPFGPLWLASRGNGNIGDPLALGWKKVLNLLVVVPFLAAVGILFIWFVFSISQ